MPRALIKKTPSCKRTKSDSLYHLLHYTGLCPDPCVFCCVLMLCVMARAVVPCLFMADNSLYLRYMFPVTEEIRQFLLNDHLYIRYSSGCCRTTSELKLRSDIPPYLLVPGSHHPRFAASFPYGLLSPSQLFSIYAVYYRLGKIHMSSVFRDFFLLYVCSLLLNGIFTDCK